jgi:hypothetical protein
MGLDGDLGLGLWDFRIARIMGTGPGFEDYGIGGILEEVYCTPKTGHME